MTVRVQVVGDAGGLERFVPGWDALAVASSCPRSAPALVGEWYRHAMPPGAAARAFVATDGRDVVGVLPLFVRRAGRGMRYAPAGADAIFGVGQLAAPGYAIEVADAVAQAVVRAEPRPDALVLNGLSADSPWSAALDAAWPKGWPAVRVCTGYSTGRVHLDTPNPGRARAVSGSSAREARRSRRRMSEEGFVPQVFVDAAGLTSRLPDLQRLYRERQVARGGAGYVFDGRVVRAIAGAAHAVDGSGRIRLLTVERPGAVAAAVLELAAGDEVSSWLIGFDARWSKWSPGRWLIANEIAHAEATGARVLDLGAGDEPYKQRWIDGTRELEAWTWRRKGFVELAPAPLRRRLAPVRSALRRGP